jgi:hypothetical protein
MVQLVTTCVVGIAQRDECRRTAPSAAPAIAVRKGFAHRTSHDAQRCRARCFRKSRENRCVENAIRAPILGSLR